MSGKMAYVYVILDTETDDLGNIIPCIVKENETGYYRTNWKWGKDIEIARRLADEYNEKLGISKDEAYTLVLKSMRLRKEEKRKCPM